ncbi:glycosyltransferase [Candidatus Bathyarchaeota archaeon]|nr:glycosyltransferase [Candidatus Bathyarchaeota archaeon]
MKKVLIIAHLFHASPRIPGLAKYLPKFGWQPIILTTPLGENPDSHFGPPNDFRKNNRVIETTGYSSSYGRRRLASKRYGSIRQFLKFFYRYYREIAYYPDSEKAWKPFAINAAENLLQNEEIEAIISCSSPVTVHTIAKELKVKHNVPWIADFRDLWTQNHNYQYSSFRKMFEKRLEIKTLALADALVTVSPVWTKKLQTFHKGKQVYTITNGFDPEKISNGPTKLTPNFTITYTGQIYKGNQDPVKILIALSELISQKEVVPNDIEVRFYGPEDEELAGKIEEFGLSAVVKQHGTVSRETSFEKQRKSQVLLLFDWEDRVEKGVIPGKIFEYFAAMRPILCTGGFNGNAVETLLNETNSGVHCPTIREIKKALAELCLEYGLHKKVEYKGDIEKIRKYSYLEMARKFAEILESSTRNSGKN